MKNPNLHDTLWKNTWLCPPQGQQLQSTVCDKHLSFSWLWKNFYISHIEGFTRSHKQLSWILGGFRDPKFSVVAFKISYCTQVVLSWGLQTDLFSSRSLWYTAEFMLPWFTAGQQGLKIAPDCHTPSCLTVGTMTWNIRAEPNNKDREQTLAEEGLLTMCQKPSAIYSVQKWSAGEAQVCCDNWWGV